MGKRAVFFDLYNTLLVPDELAMQTRELGRVFSLALAEHGIALPVETADRVFGVDIPVERISPANGSGQDGLTIFERRLDAFLNSEGLMPTREAVQSGAVAILNDWDSCWILDPDAAEVLSEIRGREYATALVTNYDHYPYIKDLIPRLGISELFDEIVVSSEVGFDKPQPGIFQMALRALGVEPGDTTHVGDDDVDIEGAIAAGIRPIRIARDPQYATYGDELRISDLPELLSVV